MRHLLGFLCACALGLMPLIGCETADNGGTGGTAGAGGSAGDGGSGGTMGQEFPCTEQGIRDAIAEGGGPHTFDCAEPTTVVTEATIEIDNDVILDGADSLTVDGDDSRLIFFVPSTSTVELRRLTLSRGRSSGGAIENDGTLAMTNVSVLDSKCEGQDACAGGGIRQNAGTLTLRNSTVSGNSAYLGGGISSRGTLTLTNSTVSGNSANVGGGIYTTGEVTLTNSTVSGNTTDEGADIDGTNLVALTNSLVDGDCASGLSTSNGYNIESPGNTCGFDEAKGDQFGVTEEELNLGPLADNGGPTMTHALLTEPTVSVAIDAIPQEDCEVDTDQRGKARPSGLESKCDVGSFEVQVPFACTEQGIRDAIAAGGGPHTFDCLYPWDLVGTEAEIVIDNNVILDGQGILTVIAGLQHRVFWVPEGVSAELRGLHVMRGLSEEGSGIWNQGTLSLVDVTVSENVAQYPGGGIRNEGTLTISNSTVWGNISLSPGGGLHNDNSGTMAIMNSTVSDNFAGEGADQISNQGQLNVTNSTLSGGAHNVCCAGADLHPEGGSITISNTVVDGFCDSESAATIQSNGYNIESPGNTCGFDQTGDQPDVTAAQLNLGPLANNSGPTMTHKPGDGGLGEGSAAIDWIPGDACDLTEDQRSQPRPETGGTMCDVGSVEVQPEL